MIFGAFEKITSPSYISLDWWLNTLYTLLHRGSWGNWSPVWPAGLPQKRGRPSLFICFHCNPSLFQQPDEDGMVGEKIWSMWKFLQLWFFDRIISWGWDELVKEGQSSCSSCLCWFLDVSLLLSMIIIIMSLVCLSCIHGGATHKCYWCYWSSTDWLPFRLAGLAPFSVLLLLSFSFTFSNQSYSRLTLCKIFKVTGGEECLSRSIIKWFFRHFPSNFAVFTKSTCIWPNDDILLAQTFFQNNLRHNVDQPGLSYTIKAF